MTAPALGMDRLGRDQGLLMMWLNRFMGGDKLPVICERKYFDTLIIDPRDFDPDVKLTGNKIRGQPNWHLVLFSLCQRELVVARFELNLTTTVIELRYPEDFRMRLAFDR